jgi:hypothetical protein
MTLKSIQLICGCHVEISAEYDPMWDDIHINDARVTYPCNLHKHSEELLNACKELEDHLSNAPFNYENGVTDPSSGLDEGTVTGWQVHEKLLDMLRNIIGQVEQ